MKNRIITLTFIFFLLTSFLLCQIKKDDLISEKERRRLASKPKISITSLLNGNYFNKLDILTGLKTGDPTAKQTILLLSFSLGEFLLPTSYEVRLTGHPGKSCPS